ncbi:dicarboxylate/amino acid:cation symporter [Sphingomonas sp. ID0503]|uniref:dicarboxylate/amino acid:cation symporter n=1 Tax=Sphingomonas sp. ID0503 TaxID=3399691 RepID=UPI003AFB12CD
MNQPARILAALLIGLALGIAGGRFGWALAVNVADPIGSIWIDALRMTVVPLVVALLVTGILRTAGQSRGGGLALKAVLFFVALLWLSTLISAFLTPALLAAWPLGTASRAALDSAMGQAPAVTTSAPPLGDFIRSIVPTNPLSAAVNDAMLPLIVFTTLFALAAVRLEEGARATLENLFSAIEQAMLTIVGWVLWIAPLGVFALAFVLGARAGTAAIGALAHYIAIVSAAGLAAWALAYPVALLGARVRLGAFIRAVAPAQIVALSTQSSLATLPTMLKCCERLGVPVAVAGVPLPIAVAIFRVTSPAMNLAVAIYVAHLTGTPLSAATIAAGAVVAGTTTLGTISLPGQVSFLTSTTPIALAMGVPLAPLGLLLAVEMIPDLVRTVGNVTMDVAATTALARHEGALDASTGA